MAVDEGLIEWIRESLEPMGHVTARHMMGGMTLFLDGTIFAIAADDELYFKADGESDAIWDEAGCGRFTYDMGEGRTGSMNYRRAPADVYDDADEMRRLAAIGLAAGLRAPVRKPKKPKAATRKPV